MAPGLAKPTAEPALSEAVREYQDKRTPPKRANELWLIIEKLFFGNNV